MKKIYIIASITVLVMSIIGINAYNNEKADGEGQEMVVVEDNTSVFDSIKGLSLEENIDFYVNNCIDNISLDSFFVTEILPMMNNLNVYEQKDICQSLAGTPAYKSAKDIYTAAKDAYMSDIRARIDSIGQSHCDLFKEQILPAIHQELDSMLTADIKSVMDEFSGGFLNYKNIARPFKMKNIDLVSEKWKEHLNRNSYNALVNNYQESYIKKIEQFRNSYFEMVTGDECSDPIDYSTFSINVDINDSIMKQISDFSSEDMTSLLVSGAKDFVVPIGLTVATSGSYAVIAYIYDGATLIYDGCDLYKEIKGRKISKEDVFVAACAMQMQKDIQTKSLKPLEKNMSKTILDANNDLYNKIDNYFNI